MLPRPAGAGAQAGRFGGAAGRLSVEQIEEEGWLTIVPDLAVEVVSPNDTAYEVEQKAREYLGVGARLVWVVYPNIRSVRVHRPDGTEAMRREGDELGGESVLPGFACRVGELFPAPSVAAGA